MCIYVRMYVVQVCHVCNARIYACCGMILLFFCTEIHVEADIPLLYGGDRGQFNARDHLQPAQGWISTHSPGWLYSWCKLV